MYGELQRIRNKTIVINYSELRMPSSERIVKVAFGSFGHRPRYELNNFRKQGKNSVAWDNCSAVKNCILWNKSKNITFFSEKRLWLILHIRIYIRLEIKFVENHIDCHSQSLSRLTQTAHLCKLRIFLRWSAYVLADCNTTSTHTRS
jgi:hypothetical protein